MPSGPSSFSRKPRTSRLRSPIIAITVTSAELWRDIEPSSVLLPTPLPPKMPMRWPLPQGSSPSIARMPVTSGCVMCSRSSGLAGVAVQAVGVSRFDRRAAVHRLAEAVDDAAEQARAHLDARVLAARRHRSPSCRPSISSSGIESTRPSRKPITWVRMRRPSAVWISQKSPIATRGPARLHQQPDHLGHLAGPAERRRCGPARRSRARARCDAS